MVMRYGLYWNTVGFKVGERLARQFKSAEAAFDYAAVNDEALEDELIRDESPAYVKYEFVAGYNDAGETRRLLRKYTDKMSVRPQVHQWLEALDYIEPHGAYISTKQINLNGKAAQIGRFDDGSYLVITWKPGLPSRDGDLQIRDTNGQLASTGLDSDHELLIFKLRVLDAFGVGN